MFESWHEFYALLGTAAAALVALLFVAASIGASTLTPERAGATRTFLSPVVFHFSNILFLSLIVLIPGLSATSFGLTIGVAATISLIYSTVNFIRVMRDTVADLADRLAYGAVPVATYAAGIVAARLFLTHSIIAGLYVLAAAALLLLLVNIRNAWDLMVFFLVRRSQPDQRPKSQSDQKPKS